MSVTTLVLADDHRAVREGLRARLSDEPDLEIIGEAADGREALEAVERLQLRSWRDCERRGSII